MLIGRQGLLRLTTLRECTCHTTRSPQPYSAHRMALCVSARRRPSGSNRDAGTFSFNGKCYLLDYFTEFMSCTRAGNCFTVNSGDRNNTPGILVALGQGQQRQALTPHLSHLSPGITSRWGVNSGALNQK